MLLSAYKPTSNPQLRLWEEPLGNHGHVRTILGDYAEELTARFFNGRRHKTDSMVDYCPDVSVGPVYLEVKTMGRSKQTWIYSGRLERDIGFAVSYQHLFYCLWKHGTVSRKAKTVTDLKALFLNSLEAIYLIPFDTMLTIAQTAPKTPTNSKYYGHHGGRADRLYGEASRIRLSEIEALPHYKLEVSHVSPQDSLEAIPSLQEAPFTLSTQAVPRGKIQDRRSKRLPLDRPRLAAANGLSGSG